MKKRAQFKRMHNVTLKNILNSEHFICDIINEDIIDGKQYFVVSKNNRVFKLARDSYVITKRG